MDTKEFNSIQGWITPDEANTLNEFASKSSGPIAEIGSFKGKSSYCLSRGTAYSVYCIDLFYGYSHCVGGESYSDFLSNMRRLKCKNIHPIFGDSKIVHEIFADRCLGMLFIDGDHAYDSVKADYYNWKPKVMPGGYILFHDSHWKGDLTKIDFGQCEGVEQFIAEIDLEHVCDSDTISVFKVGE